MPRRRTSSLDLVQLRRLLKRQDGVIGRRQVLDLGGSRADVRRRLARGEWTALHPGVYVDHTGIPSRRQRQWAAVLACWPAALHRESALEAHGLTSDRRGRARDAPVSVAVATGRHVVPPKGVTLERIKDFDRHVQGQRRPPRTTPRLLDTLDRLVRLPGRRQLRPILADVAHGTRSVLEHRYLVDVERAHGLPTGERQLREDTLAGVVHRDVRYAEQDVLVELDGAFGHTDAQDRWQDLERDLTAVIAGSVTLRPGWLQVLQPCRLARIVALVLRARGWTGRPIPCGPDCLVDVGDPSPT